MGVCVFCGGDDCHQCMFVCVGGGGGGRYLTHGCKCRWYYSVCACCVFFVEGDTTDVVQVKKNIL